MPKKIITKDLPKTKSQKAKLSKMVSKEETNNKKKDIAEKNSSEFAIIKTGGKQYKVKQNQIIKVEKLKTASEKIEFDDLISSKKVVVKVEGHGKSPKITVIKFHKRKRYKKVVGHRQPYTILKIISIK